MITLDQVIRDTRDLPPLPPTALRLARALASKSYSVDECAEIIRYDEALTLEVLRYANSAFSGPARPIAEIREAVIRLGGGRILSELLARHLQPTMSAALEAYGYAEKDLWRHSVASASAAEVLSGLAPAPLSGLVFTAALLHDIGKLLLARAAPKALMVNVWVQVAREGLSCERAERLVLGFSHAEAGAALAAAWEMPECIVHGIRFHHGGEEADFDPLTDCVMAANITARSIGEGVGHEGMSTGLDERVAKRMGLTRDMFERVCAQTAVRVREVIAFFGT
jgi:putative nucleotidyltransferase with HDIG domain